MSKIHWSTQTFPEFADFTRAHDQLGKLLDDLILENEELRKLATMEAAHPSIAPVAEIEELRKLRRKLGLVTP